MQAMILGIPVSMPPQAPPFRPHRGSIQVAAECCGRIVWQGPAQQLLKSQEPELPIICAWCAVQQMKDEGYSYEDAVKSVVALTDKNPGD